MLDNILVASVGAADASNALEYAIRLARSEDARINLLSIIPTERTKIRLPGPDGIYIPVSVRDAPAMADGKRKAEEHFNTLASRCEKAGISYSAQMLVAPWVPQVLNNASLMDIIVSQRSESRDYSVTGHFFFNSPWLNIVRQSRCSLLLVLGESTTFRSTVLVYDWTPKSANAVRWALKLSSLLNLSLHILLLRVPQKRGLISLPHPNALLQRNDLVAGVQIKEMKNRRELYQELQRLGDALTILSARRSSFLWGIGHKLRQRIKDASGAVCIVP